jgi:hypothetical protein
MQVCRDSRGGHALSVLTVDTAVLPAAIDEITGSVGAAGGVVARVVDLTDS